MEGSEKTLPSPGIRVFEATVTLVRALAWPILLILVYLNFRGPIDQSVELIPQMLAQSSKVTIGSLAFEISRSVQATGNAQLINAVGGVSPDALKLLLSVGPSTVRTTFAPPYYTEKNLAAHKELERRGLLTLTMKEGSADYKLTPLGMKVYDVVLDAIISQVGPVLPKRP